MLEFGETNSSASFSKESDLCDPVFPGEGQGRIAVHSSDDASEESELSAFLSLVQYDVHYRVDETLKESATETTQRVTFVADDGTEQGPYVRKYLKAGQGIGVAYDEIRQAQKQGAQFEHLPEIYASYQLKDELVVIMGYVQGETLQDVVYRCDASPELAIGVFPQICEAVRELHEGFDPPIIHRDLKPTNLILSWGKVTLIDFGIARTYRKGNDADTTHFGTRAYAPPEQFGFGQTDVRSDVYALGMLLFYCLTERTAETKDRETAFLNPGVPEEFRRIIAKACAFDPDSRFASVAEMQQEFLCAANAYQERMSKRAALHASRADGESSQGGVQRETELTEKKSSVLSSVLNKIPIGVGMVWNAALLLFWLLIAAACVTSCFWPSESMLEVGYPLWFRVVEYFVFMLPSATCIAYELSDRRLPRRKFPMLCRWPLWAEFLVVAVAVPFALALVMTFCAQFVGLY